MKENWRISVNTLEDSSCVRAFYVGLLISFDEFYLYSKNLDQ